MHNYVTPESVAQKVIRRLGKTHALATRSTLCNTALVVIDMQNYYVART